MIEPMLAKEGKLEELKQEDYIGELKIDGTRVIAINSDDETKLQNRRGEIISYKFPELKDMHKKAKECCILDGEVASADFKFETLARRTHLENSFDIRLASKRYPVVYWVFDIISLNGEDLTKRPLLERKAILEEILISDCGVRFLPYTNDLENLLKQTRELGLEGIMAKRKNSTYQMGKRSYDWLKIKNFKEAVFWVVGCLEGERALASLILAEEKDGKMIYRGDVGSGISDGLAKRIVENLSKIREDKCPFEKEPNLDRKLLFWTKSVLKAEVRFLEKTEDGKLRFPSFKGFRR